MIRCACLAYAQDNKILLVRVRENETWYFPGGKIDEGESPETALIREIKEELMVDLNYQEIKFVSEVVGPNHDHKDIVSLLIFTTDKLGFVHPSNEVNDVKWFGFDETEYMAPAVIESLRIIKNVI
ncbi:NUDIX domain-containing protein [Photorhabdus sp. RM71S]|uniref:NUDIX hydrolase n=1 Tax=Photorhabdus sp. RM71S TaxID=3342824 RepID=UPI0036DBF165